MDKWTAISIAMVLVALFAAMGAVGVADKLAPGRELRQKVESLEKRVEKLESFHGGKE